MSISDPLKPTGESGWLFNSSFDSVSATDSSDRTGLSNSTSKILIFFPAIRKQWILLIDLREDKLSSSNSNENYERSFTQQLNVALSHMSKA